MCLPNISGTSSCLWGGNSHMLLKALSHKNANLKNPLKTQLLLIHLLPDWPCLTQVQPMRLLGKENLSIVRTAKAK